MGVSVNYEWRCKFCSSPNSAGLSDCANCGRPAIARPIDIDGKQTVSEVSNRTEEPMSDGSRMFCMLFGLYLVIGAAFMAYRGSWFIGFPPQLDLAYFLLGKSIAGVYVEAGLAAVLGIFFIWVPLAR